MPTLRLTCRRKASSASACGVKQTRQPVPTLSPDLSLLLPRTWATKHCPRSSRNERTHRTSAFSPVVPVAAVESHPATFLDDLAAVAVELRLMGPCSTCRRHSDELQRAALHARLAAFGGEARVERLRGATVNEHCQHPHASGTNNGRNCFQYPEIDQGVPPCR